MGVGERGSSGCLLASEGREDHPWTRYPILQTWTKRNVRLLHALRGGGLLERVHIFRLGLIPWGFF